MDHSLARIQFWFKRGLAVVLFVGLLVGASATAFYALAAGISALSGVSGQAVFVTPQTFIQPVKPASQAAASGASDASIGPAGNATAAPVLENSVSAAIDGGGFALGNHLEQTFGSVLGGVLNTLFLDQSGAPGTSSPPGGTSG